MDRGDLQKLVRDGASQARSMEATAQKVRGVKRQAAIDNARKSVAACQVAAGILGEAIPDGEVEERIKALFLAVEWS